MRILVNTPVKLQNEKNKYNPNPSYCCKKSMINDTCIACRKLDGTSLNWPIESRAVTIATFLKEKWQKQDSCGEDDLIYDPLKESIPFKVLRSVVYPFKKATLILNIISLCNINFVSVLHT